MILICEPLIQSCAFPLGPAETWMVPWDAPHLPGLLWMVGGEANSGTLVATLKERLCSHRLT